MLRPKIIAFDINETVFSLETIRPRLTALGLPATALEVWFASALRDAFAIAITDRFAPFRAVLEGALASLLSTHDLSSTPDEIASVLDGMAELKPHPMPSRRSRCWLTKGFGLSRSATVRAPQPRSCCAAVASTAMSRWCCRSIRCSDPSLALRSTSTLRKPQVSSQEEMALVATHAWDTHGAKAVGLITGFVARGQTYPGVLLQPDVQGETLLDVAHALVNITSSS